MLINISNICTLIHIRINNNEGVKLLFSLFTFSQRTVSGTWELILAEKRGKNPTLKAMLKAIEEKAALW